METIIEINPETIVAFAIQMEDEEIAESYGILKTFANAQSKGEKCYFQKNLVTGYDTYPLVSIDPKVVENNPERYTITQF